MRLLFLPECDLQNGSLVLKSFTGSSIPKYAILSHRWTEDEVLFEDVEKQTAVTRKGYFKLEGAILRALADGYTYLWDDTCCIDKSSSTELSEAINSMWTWYQEAATCYAYLCDVSPDDTNFESAFRSSVWFTRGWTLQELIAPRDVCFYDETWSFLGTRESLCSMVSRITGIETKYLSHEQSLSSASIAKRMSWAAKRQTTRIEDTAYCLMGIFSINMPMLYGEGSKAFQRLQEEILKSSDDESIFAWRDQGSKPGDVHGLLAASPLYFVHSGNIGPRENVQGQEPFQITSRGLKVQRRLSPDRKRMPLFCRYLDQAGYIYISITCLSSASSQYARSHLASFPEYLTQAAGKLQTLYFPQQFPDSNRFSPILDGVFGFDIHLTGQTIRNSNYFCEYQRLGLHPLSEDTKETVGAFAPHVIPKHGTHVDLIFQFRRRSDGARICIMIGSLNAVELGFSTVKGHARGPAQVAPYGANSNFDFYENMYATTAVPTGSSMDVESSHRVSVTHTRRQHRHGVGRPTDVLEVDITALEGFQGPSPEKSRCNVQ